MIRAIYTRIVGALCVAAATVPLTARTTLEIWEMVLMSRSEERPAAPPIPNFVPQVRRGDR
jgi:hypothetical protein